MQSQPPVQGVTPDDDAQRAGNPYPPATPEEDESQRIQKAVSRMEYVTKLLVTQVAKALEMHLFMGGDFVIRKDITLNRAMYIVDSGKVMLLGSDVLKPWGMSFSPEGECFGDRSIAAWKSTSEFVILVGDDAAVLAP